MSIQLAINRHARNLIAYLQDHVPEITQADKEIFDMMQGLQSIFPQWVLTTCPVKHPNVRFITSNCEAVFGYKPESLTKGTITFFSYILDDDYQELQQCFGFIEDFLKNHDPDTYSSLRCIFHYRFMHGSGRIITVRDEKAMMQLQNNTSLYYSILKDVTQEIVYTGVKVEIIKHGVGIEKLAEYKPSGENIKLSKREHELIGLIQRGFTTKEMAHHLGISHNTVRNIRQKMFEKYKVNNAIELLNRATN